MYFLQMIRLGMPWSEEECRENLTVTDYRYSSMYTRSGCQMECYSRYFNRACGCDIKGDHRRLFHMSIDMHIGYILLLPRVPKLSNQ